MTEQKSPKNGELSPKCHVPNGNYGSEKGICKGNKNIYIYFPEKRTGKVNWSNVYLWWILSHSKIGHYGFFVQLCVFKNIYIYIIYKSKFMLKYLLKIWFKYKFINYVYIKITLFKNKFFIKYYKNESIFY